MKDKITVGQFIDELRETNIFEILIFLHVWEETEPIFHGKNYRLRPVTKDFIDYLLNEIELCTMFLLNGSRDKPKIFELTLASMNKVLEMVNTMANKYVVMGQAPQILVGADTL